jgi:5-methylcytosine-specific restriction endonuclease McrA
MARIRSVHPGLFTDEAYLDLTAESPLAIGLLLSVWCESDDNGVFEWRPTQLKMRGLPAANCNVRELLADLERVGFVRQFTENGKIYGACKNFCKWQRPKSPLVIHVLPKEMEEYVGLNHREERDGKPDRGTALGKHLLETQDGKCFYCDTPLTFYRKKPNSLEVDHKMPMPRGGSDSMENLAATCRRCNSLKGILSETEFRAKFKPEELRKLHGYDANNNSEDANNNSEDAKILSEIAKSNFGECESTVGNPESGFGNSDSPESGIVSAEGGGRRERKKNKDSCPKPQITLVPPPGPDLEFKQFYQAYRRKEAKGAAEKAFKAARKKASMGQIMAGLERFVWPTDPTFIPLPATWLNQQRWLEEPPTPQQSKPSTGWF